jgi:hypothetical protein
MKTNKNIKVEYKGTQLFSNLEKSLTGKMNLARIKFFEMFICALCKVQTVGFQKLAVTFETPAKSGSSLRRIQRFIAEYALDTDIIARLIFKMLPHKPPFKLILDRTNWKFGQTNINVLTLAIAYQGVAFPILITMLDKRGNSHTKERISLINRYIELFGYETIDCLLADREFIGEHWIDWLNRSKIRYYIRIRENFWVERNGKHFKAFWLFNHLKCGKCDFLKPIYSIKGQRCYLSASKIKHNGVPELQIVISFNEPENAQKYYKERWQIETAFRALKSNGFNIEDTHLTDLKRIEKLFSIVMVAFAWAYVVGIFADKNIEKIRILKHGRPAKSTVKYGLEIIAMALINPVANIKMNIFKFLSYT